MTASVPSFLPYGRHLIDDDDVAAVAEVLRSASLTGGPMVARFEDAFGVAVGARHAVACANGTAALHLAALALDLGPADRVVVPSVTFLATANAAVYVGADVIFADVDPDTGLMMPCHLEEALTRAGGPVKAVFPVHLNGHLVDIQGIADVASSHGAAVVEDACHALGGVYRGRTGECSIVGACTHSTMACFSFHPVKTIAMGEGGAITTAESDLAERLVRLRNHGMVHDAGRFTEAEQAFNSAGAANPWYYEMPEPGFNYRVSEIHCALGLSQLVKLDSFLARRRQLADLYDAALAPLAPIVRPVPRPVVGDGGWHLYVVLIDFAGAATARATVMGRLREAGIGTQVHYLPVHRQPYWRRRFGAISLPGADAYYEHCLSLPLFPAMADADVARVVEALAASLGMMR